MPGSSSSAAAVDGKDAAHVARDGLGAFVQVARARVVAEPSPRRQNVVERRRRQGVDGRPAAQERDVVRDDRLHGRLLQHDLAQPDAVGIGSHPGSSAPRQIAPLRVVPAEQRIDGIGPGRPKRQLLSRNSRQLVIPVLPRIGDDGKRRPDTCKISATVSPPMVSKANQAMPRSEPGGQVQPPPRGRCRSAHRRCLRPEANPQSLREVRIFHRDAAHGLGGHRRRGDRRVYGAGAAQMAACCVGTRGWTPVRREGPARCWSCESTPRAHSTSSTVGRQIVERINGYFGYRAVAELRLLQAPLSKSVRPRAARADARRRPPARPPNSPTSPTSSCGLR